MKRSLALVLLLLAAAIVGLAPAPAAAEKVLYAVGNPNTFGVTTYNPIKVELAHEGMWLVYDRLIEWGADGNFYPGLADSWTISEDGLTWDMKLKQGVKFHDGSAFNADVAKWFLKEMENGPSAYMVGAIDTVEIVDPYHITLRLKHPEPNMLFNLSQSFMCVPSMEAYKKYGEEFGIKQVVGSGPYKFESWAPGDKLVLVKNPDYNWGSGIVENKGPAKIDRIVFRDVKEESTRFLELKTGKLDVMAGVPTMFIGKVEEDKNLKLVRLPGQVLYHMVMNTKVAPLDNALVRKGVALAVDQDQITKSVFAGAGKPAYTYLIDSLPESKLDPKYEIHFDLEGAKKALEEAGWKPGPDGVRVDKDGKKLELKLWAQNESSYRRVAEVVQAQLAKAGVDAKITLLDPSTVREQYKKGEHQLAVRSYEWENADILEWFLNSTRQGYPNVAMWHDNESDYLMQKAMTKSRSLDERIQNFKDYHGYLLSQYVWAPIYLPDQIFALGSRVVMPAKHMDRNLLGIGLVDFDLK
ncbi:MAG: ABC transporter substrate-binding protein [Pseudomonadota bacterium]